MKPLTRAIVWIWIVMQVVWFVSLFSSTSRPIWPLPPVTPSTLMFLIGGAIVTLLLVFSGLALLRGRRWAWWTIAAWSALGLQMSSEAINMRIPPEAGAPGGGHPWLDIPWGVFNLLVLIGLAMAGPPQAVGEQAKRTFLKPLTQLIAWFWSVSTGVLVAILLGGMVWFRQKPDAAQMVIGTAIPGALLVLPFAGAVALLKGKAWGWELLVFAAAVGALGMALERQYGSAAFCALSLVGLLLDPPRNWVEPTAPEPPPEEPTPALPDPDAALFQ